MSGFASGKHALGICDICGFTYKLQRLRYEYSRGRNTHIKACPTCWSEDHPQNFLGSQPVDDPQALRDARPDSAELAASRGLTYPVTSLLAIADVGTVTVTVSVN